MMKLSKAFLYRSILSKNQHFSRMQFASVKDYYAILGIKRGAREDEIKEAYRNLAKKYHPDVNTLGRFHEPDGEKFKEIAEAYAVLSVPESKLSYDLLNQETPDFLYRAQREENYKKMMQKGPDGHILKPGYQKGSYAEEKQQILQEERKRFNVDAFGRYKGGLPQKDGGFTRGKALNSPGILHEPLIHNMKINKDPDSQFVTAEDALAFKYYRNEDKYSVQRKWYWFTAKVDYEYFKFKSYATGLRWFRSFVLFVFLFLALRTYFRSRNRNLKDKTLKQIAIEGFKNSYVIDNFKVILSPNGIIKLA